MHADAYRTQSLSVNIVVFDLSTLRYRFSAQRGRVAAVAPTGEILACVDIAPTTDPREAAFRAADAALDQARVVRGNETCRVALYNPYSAEVALNAVPATQVFTAQVPVSLDAAGTLMRLEADTLIGPSCRLQRVEPTVARTSRALAAH